MKPANEGHMSIDDVVVERVLAGEVEAFAEIVRQHQRSVWRIAAYALRDVGATEELVQQVFVTVYFHLGKYERGRDFGAWLRTVARNEVRKVLRQSQRDRNKLEAYFAWASAQLEQDADESERQEALREALRRCREGLPPQSSEALRLRYDQGLPFEQISSMFDRTLAATRQLLTRARSALRQCVEKRMAHS